MDTLQATLNKLQETLNELDVVLVEEVKQLSGAQINPVSLQRISDRKSRLLSTVAYYDEQR
ncbi:MAG TPA: flagellar biosynthesis protein FlgN, partial [Erwiniaceae bacterium]|nr:flagellar biosynthesis protein FlgN [Erwiniaceae bacterium]